MLSYYKARLLQTHAITKAKLLQDKIITKARFIQSQASLLQIQVERG